MVKFDSFTAGAARFFSGITGAVFVFCLSSGLSGEAGGGLWRLSFTGGCLFMVDGSCFYHRNQSPFRHSSPIRNLSPFPDGWGSWLHGWFSCMSGICMMSKIFWLLCSNRAFMDRSRPFGYFGSCLLRLFYLFQFRPAFCNGLSSAFCLWFPLFGSGSSVWVTLEVKSRTPSDTCVFRGKGHTLH